MVWTCHSIHFQTYELEDEIRILDLGHHSKTVEIQLNVLIVHGCQRADQSPCSWALALSRL